MKQQNLVLLMVMISALALAGCGEQTLTMVKENSTDKPVVKPVETSVDVEKTSDSKTTENSGLAPFFQTDEVVYNSPKVINKDDILAPFKADMLAMNEMAVKAYEGTPAKWEDLSFSYDFYDVGTIKKAPYSGWKLVVLDLGCDGPCFASNLFRFAWDTNSKKLVSLEKLSSSEYTPTEMAAFTGAVDRDFVISGLNLPESITLPDGIHSANISSKDSDFYGMVDDDFDQDTPKIVGYSFIDLGEVAFVDPKVGNVYYSSALIGCLFVKAPDGSLGTYGYDPKLMDEKNYQMVTWNDKSETSPVSGDYSEMQHGCGIGGACYFIEKVSKDDLVEAGKTNKGIILYSAKNNSQLMVAGDGSYPKDAGEAQLALNQSFRNYEEMLQYQSETDKKPVLTYQEFLAEHPILYWQDPLGRFSSIIKNNVKPAVECGKPVVYLYPEKTMDVSVKVNEVELTTTIPEYGNGWNVRANPNGEIYNYADGQTYPYLFWEGKKNGGINANGGTVVAKADLEKFLNSSLVKMGLNENESSEFMDFWLPRMMAVEQPYVFVSFAGTEEFNKVAPLDIQPKPDTLIRVFMYYMPMNSYVDMPAQKLSSRARNGFTVVEWGGTSSDGWQTK